MNNMMILFILIAICLSFCPCKELQFTRYHFRKKSTWGKAVNRAERKCREELCGNFEDNLKKDICIRKCISKDCHKEMYAWNELEVGERDIRWTSFKGCVAEELRRKGN